MLRATVYALLKNCLSCRLPFIVAGSVHDFALILSTCIWISNIKLTLFNLKYTGVIYVQDLIHFGSSRKKCEQ